MILRHSVAYFLARSASGAINLLTIAFFTRLLPPDEYGRYALVVAAVGLLSNIGFSWLGNGLVRHMTASRGDQVQTTTAVLGVWLVLNCMLSVLVLGISSLISSEWRVLIRIGVFMLWAQTWHDLCLEAHRSNLKPARYAVMLLLRSGMTLLVGVLSIQQDLGALGALTGALSGLILSGIVAKPAVLRLQPQAFCWETVRELAHYGLPLSLNSVFLMIVHSSDRFLIAAFLGESAAGIYSAAYDIAQQSVALVMRSVGNAAPPLIFRAYEQGNQVATQHYFERNFQILSTVGAMMVALLCGSAPSISAVVVGEAFRIEAARVIPIVALATFIVGLRTHHFMLPMLLLRTTRGVIAPSVAAAMTNVGLNLWWIPNFGIQGAAAATLVAYATALAVIVHVARALLPMPLPVRDALKISVSAGVTLVVLRLIDAPDNWYGLFVELASGVCIYAAVLGILFLREIKRYLDALGRGRQCS